MNAITASVTLHAVNEDVATNSYMLDDGRQFFDMVLGGIVINLFGYDRDAIAQARRMADALNGLAEEYEATHKATTVPPGVELSPAVVAEESVL